MNKIALLGLTSVAAFTLAACNPSANKAEGDTAAKGPAAPTTLEAPKPGLWRVTTSMEGMPGGASVPPQEGCVTEAKLEAPAASQQPGADCTTTAFARQGDAMVSTTSCKLPGNMKSDSTVKITGDFNTRYVTEVTTKIDPAPTPAMAETKITMTSERLGDCPAGQ